jgi:two-component system sensor histidine kinase UhpB
LGFRSLGAPAFKGEGVLDLAPPGFPGNGAAARGDGIPVEFAEAIEADVKRYVARELHDEVVQTLTTILLDMERFKREQFGRVSVLEEVTSLQGSVRSALDQIRAVLLDLRNQPLTTVDFVDSVRAEVAATFAGQPGMTIDLSVSPSWPAALPARAALNLQRAIQEALTNVRRHAAASSVRIQLDVVDDRQAMLVIADDGVGLDTDRRHAAEMGIPGMRERAALLGGDLSIESAPGRGTTVRLTVPLTALE